ncbi:hypothetical protein [Priestia megaterium]|uniref:hypothetical protein n=1 Tax=Priestia megaterium TaxID=1404 RepID=UPI0027306511|nr:hypothetical protein [Priestia megaterium]MDP1442572.1 hypothetical protein [Priestia megaterium]MDP1471591.1 hypothetical protein [Priestia megaterium]MDR0132202.1 hypothetical protein [Priestia megaterium]MDR4221746.1 hypothetical protein [Priestia megaterium]
MEFKNGSDRALFKELLDQSVNNNAAIQVLMEITLENTAITIDELNSRIREKAENILVSMDERLKKAKGE